MTEVRPYTLRWLTVIAGGTAVAAALIGLLVLAGWLFSIPELTTLCVSRTSMKANAALSTLLAGIAVVLKLRPHRPAVRLTGTVMACFVWLIAFVTLAEIVSGKDWGIDQLLVSEPQGSFGTRMPGQMSPNAAVCLILVSISILTMDLKNGWRAFLSQGLAGMVLMTSGLGILGYLYDVQSLYAVPSFTHLALPAGLCYMLLGVSSFMARPSKGFMRLLSGSGPGSVSARQFLLPAILLPLFLGWVALAGDQWGPHEGVSKVALLVVCNTFAFVLLIFRNAYSLERAFKATEMAKRQNEFKSRFLASISHEIRTPLTSILGFAELVQDDRIGPLSAPQRSFVQLIKNNAGHMLAIINEILDLSRMEAGALELELQPVDLIKLAREVVEDSSPLWQEHAIAITLDAPDRPLIMAIDPVRTKQIMLNLLTNAIKFSPPAGTVNVSIVERPQEVAVSVSDAGPGIAPDEKPKLFQEYVQLDRTSHRKHQGSGLGLTVAKRLVELHRGSMWVQSDVGRGAVFGFTLPRS